MSWLVRRRKSTEEASTPEALPAAACWADRLQRIGHGLDVTGMQLKSVAVSAEGGPELDWAFVLALAWRNTRYHQQWTNVTMRVNAGLPYDLMNDRDPLLAEVLKFDPDNTRLPAVWSVRYEAIGALLDGMREPMRSPSLVDLGDSVLVNTLRWDGSGNGGWGLSGFGFTNAQIEQSARAIAHARAAARAAALERKR